MLKVVRADQAEFDARQGISEIFAEGFTQWLDLGFLKGSMAGIFLKKEFESPFVNPLPGVGSIEFVGTAAEFRGQGVASQMIRHTLENTPYEAYLIEEVADTNIPAMKLYYKLGFEEYKRRQIPIKRAKKIGINYLVSLRYSNKSD